MFSGREEIIFGIIMFLFFLVTKWIILSDFEFIFFNKNRNFTSKILLNFDDDGFSGFRYWQTYSRNLTNLAKAKSQKVIKMETAILQDEILVGGVWE